MYRLYVVDRGEVYWLRIWIDGETPLLTTNRTHAAVFAGFREAAAQRRRMRAAGCDAHIDGAWRHVKC